MDPDEDLEAEALEALKKLGSENEPEEKILYAAPKEPEEPEGPEHVRSRQTIHYSPINRHQTSCRARAKTARGTSNIRSYARRRM
jgi:hypothetical protein